MNHNTILVTGGAGFIGSNFVLRQVASGRHIINLDALTYAGNLKNLCALQHDPRYVFVHASINDLEFLKKVFAQHQPCAVVHFAAESHVDRSIASPEAFIQTNVIGTFRLLEAALRYWQSLSQVAKSGFRFLHVSTDEVYGSLAADDPPFSELSPYKPNSPYSASKAASDHLVRSYYHTYGLPTLTTNCSNNYGPFQFPEKLIPLMVLNGVRGEPLPVYGDGQNVRDWLYVSDHCEAIACVLEGGRIGETYNIGGFCEKRNIEVVTVICEILDEVCPKLRSHRELITWVKDRPGHDRRYAIDASKLRAELEWQPKEDFESGLRKTIEWYLENEQWVADVTSGGYRDWITHNYAERLDPCGA